MERTKHKILAVLAVILCATLGVATAATALTSSGGVMARAERSTTAWVTVDEIYDDDAQSFDSTNLMDLIEALMGERSYDALEKAAEATTTSDGFRTANGGKNVSVYFGGMKWDAVYLTTAKNGGKDTKEGDIILDLWHSSDTLTAGDTATYSGFWSDKSTDKEYPSNMYSTSKIRVETLNAGGKYTKIIGGGPTVDLTEHSQDSGNKYARFTMESVPNSLTEYLAKPSEVGYQETEFDEGTMKSFYGYAATYYLLPNDAYNAPSDGVWYGSMNYSSKGTSETAYGAWQDDYLWLPSLTETGMSNDTVKDVYGSGPDFVGDGMWNTDAALRSANSGVGLGRCWLRSGGAYDAQRAYLLNASGNRDQLVVNNANIDKGSCGVRPALHFNLSAAARKAILDKKSWKDETKTYSPDGVKWKLVDTDMVEISAVEKDGDSSWYDEDNHTITADKVGEYELKIKPSEDFQWKDGTEDEITVTYTVVPADMTVTFNNNGSGVFNNGRLEQKREFVYSLGMEPFALKLPDPTDETFPINWKDVAWYLGTISKLKIQYIVQKYEEAEYDEDTIKNYLNDLKDERQTEEWQDYDKLTDKTAQEPMFYVVYFKAVDIEGNHNTCYDYFVIHIVAEELKITLSEAAIEGFAKGVEYGDVAHTKDAFEKDILGGIQKIIGQLDIDKTKEFKDNIENFTFYLRKDNSIQDGIVQDDGDIYTVEEGGIHLYEDNSSSSVVDNLPLGTYHLYVVAKDKDASKHLTFEWEGGRPSFKVSERRVKVTLTFEKGATYGDAHTGWVTATASRAEGADGAWYAQNEAEGDDDLQILGLSYTLQESDSAPNKTTPAGTHNVLPTWTNENYAVQFADEHGGMAFEYTIAKAPLTVTVKNKIITYGDEPSNDGVTYSGFVNGENESVLSGELTFDYGSYEAFKDVGEYVIMPSGLSSDNNYDFDYKEGTLTVRTKEINAKWSEKSYTYTGSVFTELPTATAAGIGSDGTFTLLVALSNSAQTFMNAGAYAFKATLDSANPKAKNYKLNENTKARAYIVEKQTVTAPTVASKVYNGAPQKADFDGSALYRVSENDGGTNAGDYPVKLALTDANNYKWTGSEAADIVLTFSITKALLTAPALGETFTYTGSDRKAEIEEAFHYDSARMHVAFYADAAASDDSLDEIINAGAYYARFTLTDPDNYSWGQTADMVVTFTVAKRKVTPTLTAADINATYGDSGEALHPVPKGVPQGYEVSYLYTYEGIDGTQYARSENAPVNAGKYRVTVTAICAGGANDEPFTVSATAELTIAARKLTFSLDAEGGVGGLVNTVFKDEDGNAVALAVSDYSFAYTFDGAAVEEFAQAGEYTVTVTLKGAAAANNTLINNTAVYTLTQDISGDDGPGSGEETPGADEKSDLDFGMVLILMSVAIVLLAIVLGLAIWKKNSEKNSNKNTKVKEKK